MLPAISVYFGKWKLQCKTKWKCLPCLLTHLPLHMLLNSVVGCYLIAKCMKYMRCTTFLSVCVQRNENSTGSVYQIITSRQLWTLTKTSKSKAQVDGHVIWSKVILASETCNEVGEKKVNHSSGTKIILVGQNTVCRIIPDKEPKR